MAKIVYYVETQRTDSNIVNTVPCESGAVAEAYARIQRKAGRICTVKVMRKFV